MSYAQNSEDVVLNRALGHVRDGRYIEVGANDPTVHSTTMAFYQRGWSGITIEPVTDLADRHRTERPRDFLVEAAVTDADTDTVVLHQIAGTGLSTVVDSVGSKHQRKGWAVTDVVVPARRLDDILAEAGWQGLDIHFMTVDTEGSEESVLRSVDLGRWRPWVIVVEATEPLSTRPSHQAWEGILTSADYEMVLFDGLSRFYLATEHRDDLGLLLSYPACVHDVFDTQHIVDLRATITRLDGERIRLEDQVAGQGRVAAELGRTEQRLESELAEARKREREAVASALLWRNKAISIWAEATAPSSADLEELRFLREHAHALFTELNAVKRTVSWRMTVPLRKVRTLAGRRGAHE